MEKTTMSNFPRNERQAHIAIADSLGRIRAQERRTQDQRRTRIREMFVCLAFICAPLAYCATFAYFVR
jgi:adenylosuccinate lyase